MKTYPVRLHVVFNPTCCPLHKQSLEGGKDKGTKGRRLRFWGAHAGEEMDMCPFLAA